MENKLEDKIEASFLEAEHIEALALMIQEHFSEKLTGNKTEDLFTLKRYYKEYGILLSILIEKNKTLKNLLADALKTKSKATIKIN